MGSFTELVMSFPFDPDTPINVLSAFASLRADQPSDVRDQFDRRHELVMTQWERQKAAGGPERAPPVDLRIPAAPELPRASLADDEDDLWDPTDPEADMDEPWRHDWGEWLGTGMAGYYSQSQTDAVLQWTFAGLWVLTCRATLKASPALLVSHLEWLGPYIDGSGTDEWPFQLGYMKHEYERRPWLLWHDGARFFGEDLNGPDDRD